jgi:hypothetical protein
MSLGQQVDRVIKAHERELADIDRVAFRDSLRGNPLNDRDERFPKAINESLRDFKNKIRRAIEDHRI